MPPQRMSQHESAAIQAPKLAAPQTPSGTPCTDLLEANIAELELRAPVSATSNNLLCGDSSPVRMTAVRLSDGSSVHLSPAVLAKCEMALEFARWVRDDLAVAARETGSAIKQLHIASSYSCRPMNSVKGQRMSEHGLANAIDIRSFTLADGKTHTIFSVHAPINLLAVMRKSACERFTTVLGPGADKDHTDHIHVDLARRNGGYRICQWNLPDVPQP